MAKRNIVKIGDEILKKKVRAVEVIDDRLLALLDDMRETLYANDGAGLAAPQVGVLKQCVVIDVGEGPIELINPVITKTEGSVVGPEGCLSIPGKWGKVERPQKVTVKALDRTGKQFTITGEDLLARALCHEIDHLHGILYTDKMIAFIEDEEEE